MSWKTELIKQAVDYASERDRAVERFGLKRIILSPDGYKEYQAYLKSPQYQKVQSANEILREYFESLESEEVGKLYTIMYLGRDQDSIEQALYNKQLKSANLAYQVGKNKELEINMMLEKKYLSLYLKEGAKIVGIDLE